MMTFRDRVDWIRRQQEKATGELPSYRQLSGDAGNSESALITILSRHGASESVAGSGKVLSKVARYYGVSLEWLMHGIGEPRPDALDALDRVLAERAWSEATQAAAAVQRGKAPDWTVEQWRTWVRSIEAAVAGTPLPPPSSMRKT